MSLREKMIDSMTKGGAQISDGEGLCEDTKQGTHF